jgi:hypothetical protein
VWVWADWGRWCGLIGLLAGAVGEQEKTVPSALPNLAHLADHITNQEKTGANGVFNHSASLVLAFRVDCVGHMFPCMADKADPSNAAHAQAEGLHNLCVWPGMMCGNVTQCVSNTFLLLVTRAGNILPSYNHGWPANGWFYTAIKQT